MSWITQYRMRHFLMHSFWLVPALSVIAALALARLVRVSDRVMSYGGLNFTPDGARAVLGGLSASMLTFIVFAVSALLLAVQIASGQLTPRIIALAFRQRAVKISVGAFAFSYTLGLATLGRVGELRVPEFLVNLAVVSNLVSLVMFFWFVEKLGTSLRPIAIVQSVWAVGRAVIDSVYPRAFDPSGGGPLALVVTPRPEHARVVLHAGSAGTFLAFGARPLATVAQREGCTIEIIPRVGTFVSHGDPLFRIYPAGAAIDDAALHDCVAFGPERTLEQDPAFAFRIMVDIASRALSPAVNDPTTAVIAIDQIHRLLLYAGRKELASGRVLDEHGRLLLAYPTPQWEDFVALATSEIRLFGASSIQVPRRLRAMLEHLITALPEARAYLLRQELAILEGAVQRDYRDAIDRQRAATPDLQGLGGSSTSEDGLVSAVTLQS